MGVEISHDIADIGTADVVYVLDGARADAGGGQYVPSLTENRWWGVMWRVRPAGDACGPHESWRRDRSAVATARISDRRPGALVWWSMAVLYDLLNGLIRVGESRFGSSRTWTTPEKQEVA